ncbi:MAG: T9SS type A sorting domain-containing protein [Aliifodinibius sp.]|nr:T9SS type A sorting domain-containing protein [Fodinibius sp.]
MTNTLVGALAVSGKYLFVGTFGGVFLSTNNGTNWTQVNTGLTNLDVRDLAVSDTNLFAGTYGGGVFLSTNNGTSWTPVNTGLTNMKIWALAVSDTNLFAGTNLGGVFRSTNNGSNWTEFNTGLSANATVVGFAVDGTDLIAGTLYGHGVWRRPIPQITSVRLSQTDAPTDFRLEQNYPNPFNATTTISFALPVLTHVKLSIFDLLGREVVVLVNEKLNAGTYHVNWQAPEFSTSVYFYRLETEHTAQTKRLILLK